MNKPATCDGCISKEYYRIERKVDENTNETCFEGGQDVPDMVPVYGLWHRINVWRIQFMSVCEFRNIFNLLDNLLLCLSNELRILKGRYRGM